MAADPDNIGPPRQYSADVGMGGGRIIALMDWNPLVGAVNCTETDGLESLGPPRQRILIQPLRAPLPGLLSCRRSLKCARPPPQRQTQRNFTMAPDQKSNVARKCWLHRHATAVLLVATYVETELVHCISFS
jgi:hypothetical protein